MREPTAALEFSLLKMLLFFLCTKIEFSPHINISGTHGGGSIFPGRTVGDPYFREAWWGACKTLLGPLRIMLICLNEI